MTRQLEAASSDTPYAVPPATAPTASDAPDGFPYPSPLPLRPFFSGVTTVAPGRGAAREPRARA
jgi:hypothetical protein